nr:MAG TPA: protein of unknown function (DUF882) [Microviridae sp.]
MNPALMRFLDSLLCLNYHFTITSAYRTPEQNKADESCSYAFS